eukprot:TRINITY_DN6742_c1_g1_i1.p1 TRINITY_DN6742_c1_g1~~TRINITY_DN6742_c1_g1_i1.p1  ORF type:complete len:394 (+),score=123.76 TRINITY_DN6742_c1_g1_i1:65-1183(+)
MASDSKVLIKVDDRVQNRKTVQWVDPKSSIASVVGLDSDTFSLFLEDGFEVVDHSMLLEFLPVGTTLLVIPKGQTLGNKAKVQKSILPPFEESVRRREAIQDAIQERKNLFPQWSDREWEIRTQLAAAYRLFSLQGWTDLIYNHLTARLPHKFSRQVGDQIVEEECFLINPFGLSFHEITASSLVTVNMDGDILDGGSYPERRINKAGYVVHSAIHCGRPEIESVMHCHEDVVTAVSCLGEGFLPKLNQNSMIVGDIPYHEYEGIAVRDEERARLVSDLGDKKTMILKNHGILTCGRSVAEAYFHMYMVIKASRIQTHALSMSPALPVSFPSDNSIRFTLEAAKRFNPENVGTLEFEALIRDLDRLDPSFRL